MCRVGTHNKELLTPNASSTEVQKPCPMVPDPCLFLQPHLWLPSHCTLYSKAHWFLFSSLNNLYNLCCFLFLRLFYLQLSIHGPPLPAFFICLVGIHFESFTAQLTALLKHIFHISPTRVDCLTLLEHHVFFFL